MREREKEIETERGEKEREREGERRGALGVDLFVEPSGGKGKKSQKKHVIHVAYENCPAVSENHSGYQKKR